MLQLAIRMQEKRIRMKMETEERQNKRDEEKAMKLKLKQQQEESLEAKRQEMSEAVRLAEDARMANARAKGFDSLDLSFHSLRHIPLALYENPEGRMKLTFLVSTVYGTFCKLVR